MKRKNIFLGARTVAILAPLLAFLSCNTVPPIDEPQRHLLGIGIVWSDWLNSSQLPERYRANPREYDRDQMQAVVAAGGTAIHGSFDWVGIERTRGVYNWSRADQTVEDAEALGLEMFAYIGNTPDWALPEGWASGSGWRTPPAEEYAEAFEQYCEEVAARYRGRVEHFFFWNEPNGCSWVNDNCSNGDGYALYTKWLKRAYTAIKRGNPDAIVAAGSIDYGTHVSEGYRYLEGMYRSGAKGYFDAIDIHPYAKQTADPDGIHWRAIEDTRRVMVEHGDQDKAIWLSEYGWEDSAGEAAAERLTDVLERLSLPEYEYVTYARYLVLTDLPGTTMYGLMERDLTPRPAYEAFRAFASAQSEE